MTDQKYLRMLAKSYPNHRAVKTEIINLRAIQALPRGSEFFLSDIHGEYDAFQYFVRSGAGIVRTKIGDAFAGKYTEEECDELARLIYNPEAEIARREKSEEDFDAWCELTIYRLVEVCRKAANKYTRSKVRKMLPDNSGYVMDELMYADDVQERANYYQSIIDTVIEYDAARTFICEISDTISNLCVDRLHIIGDIFDRGPKPHDVMDFLMDRKDVDIQWGNHDILWMGAACGNRACIANVLRINIRYNNFDMLEYGYGLNLRPLATLAEKVYGDDECKYFMPNLLDKNRFDPIPEDLAARMHKMMAVIQFKLDAQEIRKHPEYNLTGRNLIEAINFDKGTVMVEGKEYPMRDMNLPTVDPAEPSKLSVEEEEVMLALEASILKSEKLQEHLKYLYKVGSMYKKSNDCLFYHGCIPFTEDGEFREVELNGVKYKGAAYMDKLDEMVRDAYFDHEPGKDRAEAASIMWRLWLSESSTLYGKDKMTTFERAFINAPETHEETTVPYYSLIQRKDICEKILADFGINPEEGVILNGHMPVKIKDGENPVKGEGKLVVIDGGISKAYRKTTGIAGYTAIITSKHFYLAEHQPYEPIQEDGTQVFHNPVMNIVKTRDERKFNKDTDQGVEMGAEIKDLEALMDAFKQGDIKEYYPPKGKYYSK